MKRSVVLGGAGDDFHETLHGVDLVDPYRWLEDDGSPETRAWIDAQNNYAHALRGISTLNQPFIMVTAPIAS